MKKKIEIAVLIIAIIVFLISLYQLLLPELEVSKVETYIVSKGDTIWGIANRYIDETVDIRDYMYLIYEYNVGLSPNIKEGQAITIPILANTMNK